MARLAVFTERYTIRSSVELTALTNFRLAAFEQGHELDFLFKSELKYIRNYDGILIRALTDPITYFLMFWVPKYLQEVRGISLAELAAVGWMPYAALAFGNVEKVVSVEMLAAQRDK